MEKHELVDANGNKTGKVLTHSQVRDANNIPYGYYLDVAGVVIINDNNEILLQKRSRLKRTNPGKWGICGGKVDFGETPLEAGVRETLEEIGVLLNKEELQLFSTNIIGKVYCTVYYIKKNVNLFECKLQQEELEEVKYFKIEELNNLNNEGFEWLDDLIKIMK